MKNFLNCLVAFLIIAQIVLIGFVVRNVITITKATQAALVSKEDPKPETCQYAVDSLQVVAQKEVAPTNAPKNAIMDNSPTIISILLTLITLCVTLSVVIPYVEGKTMTESTIRGVAKEYYRDAFESIERYYAETLEDSLWEDAHSSRMTAYFLHKSEETSDKIWAIGFASKAILRYVKLIRQKPDRYGHNAYHEIDFIRNCISYMKNDDGSFVGGDAQKMLRAFSDLSYAAFLSSNYDFGEELQRQMREMYPCLKEQVSRNDIDACLRKHGRNTDAEEMKRFEKWVKGWMRDWEMEHAQA